MFLKALYLDLKTLILDTLFPIYCLVCEKQGKEFLCLECSSKLPKIPQVCIMCKKPSVAGLTHPGCKTPYAPEGLISLFDYHDESVSKLIISGKYFFVKDIYRTLGEILAQYISADYFSLFALNFTLSPIPLHWSRQNWRGFNQAEILCKSLSGSLNLKVANVLKRSKITKTQKNLKKEARKQNMNGAFKTIDDYNIKDQNFILLDDVATTGSTLLEAVKTLKINGANKVWCLTVAKD